MLLTLDMLRYLTQVLFTQFSTGRRCALPKGEIKVKCPKHSLVVGINASSRFPHLELFSFHSVLVMPESLILQTQIQFSVTSAAAK